MTRIDRPDTLLTELRDLKRRLRLLEAGRMRPSATAAAALVPPPSSGLPLMPARPTDWPATGSADWERLAVAWPAGPVQVVLHTAADAGSAGEVRVLINGVPVGAPVPVHAPGPEQSTVDTPAGGEVVVEACRTGGTGLVRVAALYRTA